MIEYEYGYWEIVVLSIGLFALFIITGKIPVKTKLERRSGGMFMAFITAVFTEMYGFPLSIYILSSFFGIKIPFTHVKGNLWASLLGLGDMGSMTMMMIGSLLIGAGIILVIDGWKQVYHSRGKLVTSGLYGYVRHPQYTGIFLITIGFLIQWPTFLTLLMWPILFFLYYRLAKKEEKVMERKFRRKYRKYKREVPMFIPKFNEFYDKYTVKTIKK